MELITHTFKYLLQGSQCFIKVIGSSIEFKSQKGAEDHPTLSNMCYYILSSWFYTKLGTINTSHLGV